MHARIGHKLTEILDNSHEFFLTIGIKKAQSMLQGISSKMNVPCIAAVVLMQFECRKQLLIEVEENHFVKVERPWP